MAEGGDGRRRPALRASTRPPHRRARRRGWSATARWPRQSRRADGDPRRGRLSRLVRTTQPRPLPHRRAQLRDRRGRLQLPAGLLERARVHPQPCSPTPRSPGSATWRAATAAAPTTSAAGGPRPSRFRAMATSVARSGRGPEGPAAASGAPPVPARRLAAGRGARRQRRHRVDRQPDRRCRRRRRVALDDPDRRSRRAGRRGDVDGCRRVRVGQLAARCRASRPRPGAPGARHRSGERTERADPDLRTTWPRRAAGCRGGPAADRTTTPSAPTSETSWASPTWPPLVRCRRPGRRRRAFTVGALAPAAGGAGQSVVAADHGGRRGCPADAGRARSARCPPRRRPSRPPRQRASPPSGRWPWPSRR